MSDSTTKRCTKCGEVKPLSEFTKHKKEPDGIRSECKTCASVYRRAYYARNAEHWREVSRQEKRTRMQSNPDAVREYKREYHHRNRDAVNKKRRTDYREQIEVRRAKDRAYRQRNHGKVRAWAKRWRDQHIEQCRQESKDSYYTHRDQRLAYARIHGPRWKAANRGAVLAMKHRRRARKAGNGGHHTAQEWRDLKAQYNNRCLCCGKCEPEITLTPDHIVPISCGGTDNIDNLQPLCRACNCKKHAKIIDYR